MLLWPDHPAFTTPLSALKGVGPKTLAHLAAEGLHTTGDLLVRAPKFYQDRRRPTAVADLAPDQEALVEGTVISARARWSAKARRRFLECRLADDQGDELTLLWFNCPAWLAGSLPRGRRLRLFGRVRVNSGRDGGRLEMTHPDLDFGSGEADADEAGPEIRPVYQPVGQLSPGLVRKLMEQSLALLNSCPPLFPRDRPTAGQLTDPIEALLTLHAPPSGFSGPLPRPDQTRAFRQLALFELICWRLMMLRTRRLAGPSLARSRSQEGLAAAESFWRALPFPASPEQLRVAAEVTADLMARQPMSRLLQGEVGSGKTAVAGAALFLALGRGGQAALMAPTEVLARQHYDFFSRLATPLGYQTALLTGSLSEKEKRAVRAGLANGQTQLAIGSQALISRATVFQNLTLAVIDEQHRFGVRQRLALRRKNAAVDLLALSATPIPRSLSLMLYGDLDTSRLEGRLPGRRPVATSLFEPGQRQEAYGRFLELIRAGGQGFLVTPRIEEASGSDPDQADDLWPSLADLQQQLAELAGPSLTIAALHGQLDQTARAEVMDSFRQGLTRVLVATSIIEVGVDVPAAQVMLIEGAERFGLAQLHQFRGRVGRSGQDGHCLLLPARLTPAAALRLRTLAREHDGQTLAELDLEMRGPGEQLGLRQSGWPALTYARLPQDLPLLPRAQALAEQLWPSQPGLSFDLMEKRLLSGLD
ncbi:MAG: ATP-dependent DNA helicase RecG [Candidatus Adiutrix sp.]|jgi:ATP-dependent DNA helicase RecG|nr:ATP-dependent DNA helicase RecG [Candidatus Adiutrix sp.]